MNSIFLNNDESVQDKQNHLIKTPFTVKKNRIRKIFYKIHNISLSPFRKFLGKFDKFPDLTHFNRSPLPANISIIV